MLQIYPTSPAVSEMIPSCLLCAAKHSMQIDVEPKPTNAGWNLSVEQTKRMCFLYYFPRILEREKKKMDKCQPKR